jgi:ubiquinone/menaquinone biosynthesis C-methylase UbiE
MGYHTFDPERADKLEEDDRYRWCSGEELLTQISPDETATVADLGSGTGFYTDVVSPHVDTVHAVDVQPEMHERYEQKGVPSNVTLVEASIEELPLEDDALDVAFSTMTYHEFSGEDSMAELARVVRPGGRLVTVDWTASGSGQAGPPLAERHTLDHAVAEITTAGFTVDQAVSRTETFVCRAYR